MLAFPPTANGTFLHEVHWFAADWVMIIVGINIGLQWTRVLTSISRLLGPLQPNRAWIWLLLAAAALFVLYGIASWSVLDLCNKLTHTSSMEFWDFTASE